MMGCFLARVARAGLPEEVTFELWPGQRWNQSWDHSRGKGSFRQREQEAQRPWGGNVLRSWNT